MTRREDWPLRLNARLEAARDREFVWGEHDCALFAADVARDLTGVDHAAAFRGQYATAAGAARALRKHGRGTLRATAGAMLGAEIEPLKAQRGDLLLWVQSERGETLGVCVGAQGAFAGPKGLVFIPVKDCVTAWRV